MICRLVTPDRFNRYFSQNEVLDRVPEIFLVMGGLTLALQVIGLALIRDPQEGDQVGRRVHVRASVRACVRASMYVLV